MRDHNGHRPEPGALPTAACVAVKLQHVRNAMADAVTLPAGAARHIALVKVTVVRPASC